MATEPASVEPYPPPDMNATLKRCSKARRSTRSGVPHITRILCRVSSERGVAAQSSCWTEPSIINQVTPCRATSGQKAEALNRLRGTTRPPTSMAGSMS